MKRGYKGYLICKNRINEMIGILNSLVDSGDINPYDMDSSALMDYMDSDILGNLMNSPVWRNTVLCWFFRQYPEEVIEEDFRWVRAA